MAKPQGPIHVWAREDVNLPSTGRPNKAKPIDDLLNKGYDKGQKPAAEEFNYILNSVTDWTRYQEEERLPQLEEDIQKEIEDLREDFDKTLKEDFTPFLVPVGAVVPWPGETPPGGWLECNGQTYSTTDNPRLYEVLGESFVPDYRGLFLRGWAHGSSVFDPDSGRDIGSVQQDAIRNIYGEAPIGDSNRYHTGSFKGAFTTKGSGYIGSSETDWDNPIGVFDASRVVPTAPENRPKNVAVMFIIKTDRAESSGVPAPVGIGVSPTLFTGAVGDTQVISASVLPSSLSSQYPVSFSSSDTSVVTISSSGFAELVGAGTANITVSISTGMHVLIPVTSHILMTSLAVTGPEEITVGENAVVTIAQSPLTATEPVTYTSSDTSRVVVDISTGSLSGISPGTATITATGTISGISSSRSVTVLPAPVVTTIEDIQLGLVTIAEYGSGYNGVPPGCTVVGGDWSTVDGISRVGYKPIMKKVQGGNWVIIEG